MLLGIECTPHYPSSSLVMSMAPVNEILGSILDRISIFDGFERPSHPAELVARYSEVCASKTEKGLVSLGELVDYQ